MGKNGSQHVQESKELPIELLQKVRTPPREETEVNK